MAILNQNNKPVGSVGSTTYKQIGDLIIASVKVDKRKGKAKTEAQVERQILWPNVVNAWKYTRHLLIEGFERERPTQSVYNMFMSMNTPTARVALTKREGEMGYAILDNFVISRGSLEPCIGTTSLTQNKYISDICLGNLQITENTTLAEVSNAIIASNPKTGSTSGLFKNQDQIMCYLATQVQGTEYTPPYINIDLYKFTLNNRADEAKF